MKQLLLLVLMTFVHLAAKAQVNDGSMPKSFTPAFHLSTHIPLFEMPALDMDAIQKEDAEHDAKGVLQHCGRIQPTFITPQLHGVWDGYPSGERIWRTRIQSKDAQGITLYFSDFNIPQGAKIYVYSLDKKQVLGGFTAANNQESGKFALGPIYSDDIIVEYYEPANVAGLGKFTIDDIGHMYRFAHNYKTTEDFGDSESCQVNVNCSPEGTGKTQQRDATARILVRVGATQGWCTGSMVNNVLQNCTRYFLTAMHCGLDGNTFASTSDLNQWIFYFNYQASGCSNPASQGTLANQSLTGAAFRANSNDGGGNTGSDFLLLELNTAIPAGYNVFFAGWNVANTASTSGYGIHHPAGDIKKISSYTSTLASTSWGGTVANTHWQVTWAATTNGHGVTEGGSSGSPLFNSSGLIVGTLTGGGSFCTSPTSPDAYGKMSYHWTSNGAAANRQLKAWLDPNNTGVTSLTGTYFPCTPAVALDAGIESITNPADGSSICDNPFVPTVVLKNFGTTTLTSVTINYRINALTPATYAWSGSLATNASTTVTLPAVNVTVGAGVPFTFNAYTSSPNSSTDGNASNDGVTVNTELRSFGTIPYSEPFNTGSLPANIDVYNPNGDGFQWAHTTAASAYGTGTGSIRYDNFNGTSGSNPGGTLDWFFLPPMSFVGKTDVGMSFDVAYRRYNASTNDSLIVAINTDCGTTYSVIYLKGGATLATVATTSTTAFTPTSAQWRHDSIDLSAFDGEPNVIIAFINKSDWGQFLYVDNINVQSACAMTSSISSTTNVSCNGGSNGAATVTPASGTPAYTYQWSNGRTTAANTGLTAGTYIVTITDANGCKSNSSVTITQPTAVTASIASSTSVTCNGGATGTATANGTGGTGSKTYLWSNGRTTASNTGLVAGAYTVTVTDANGCVATSSVTITQPANAVSASISSSSNVLCNGGSTGTATATGSGGTGVMAYAWSNGRTTASNTGLAAGSYSVTVTDANGCTASSSVNISQPTALSSSINDNGNGTATASGTGGTGAYTYQWGVTTGNQTTATATGLVHNNTYTVTVTDANGCTATANVTVNIVGLTDIPNLMAFEVFPNPNDGNFQIQIAFNQPKDANIRITNVLGQTLQEYNFNEQVFNIPVDIQQQASGVYFVVLLTEDKIMTKKITITK